MGLGFSALLKVFVLRVRRGEAAPAHVPAPSHACSLTTSGVMLGTSLMENLPTTFLGITVLAPDPEKAPSIP